MHRAIETFIVLIRGAIQTASPQPNNGAGHKRFQVCDSKRNAWRAKLNDGATADYTLGSYKAFSARQCITPSSWIMLDLGQLDSENSREDSSVSRRRALILLQGYSVGSSGIFDARASLRIAL